MLSNMPQTETIFPTCSRWEEVPMFNERIGINYRQWLYGQILASLLSRDDLLDTVCERLEDVPSLARGLTDISIEAIKE